MLGRKGCEQLLLYRALRHEQIDLHRILLPHAMRPCDALFENGGVPRKIHIDDRVRRLKVEPGRARVRGEKHAACRIALKLIHQQLTLLLWNRTIEPDVIEPESLYLPLDQGEHRRPL